MSSSAVAVLRDPIRNQGTAFTHAHCAKLGLAGLLPPGVQTLEQQDQIRDAMVRGGAQPQAATGDGEGRITLATTVAEVHPTILVGTSTVGGAFTEPIAREMDVNMGRRPGVGCHRQAARRRQDARLVTFPDSRNAHRRLPGDAGDITLRCLIVDDSRRFLDAARGLLERQGITVVGEASTSAEALRLAVELQPDVTLLDIDLGGESGCELAGRLSRETNTALSRMILISTHAEEDYADLIAASPAVGFLPKSTLSAGAIRDLLGSQRDRDPGDLGPVPQIFSRDHDACIHQDPRDRP
jgi:CheY-like chemotaxis protein